MITPKFPSVLPSFHGELKSRVSAYFKEVGKPTSGSIRIIGKALFFVISFIAIYIHLVFYTPAVLPAVIECIILGCLTAGIGFNVMHDGAHGSFSNQPWINSLAGASANILGASVHMWKTKHNIIHHTYTNIDGVDDDIEAKPIMRLCSSQKYYLIHRFQHIYFWLAYSVLYIWWIFFTDYKKYFSKRIGSIAIKKMTAKEHFSFWFYKAVHFILFVIVPIYFCGFMPWLVGFLTMGLVAGFVLSIVFQLAHTVEHTHFPTPLEDGKMSDEWALHQLKTTANFATKNKLVSWFVGGLNFQIEHHLFPKISHIHYPAMSIIIKKACEEYNVNYIEYKRMHQAIGSHIAYLYHLSKKTAH